MSKTRLFSMTQTATAAVVSNRLVGMMTGAHCASGAKALGVSHFAAATGEAFAVTVSGTEVVEAGGAFAAGGPLKAAADGSGKVIAQGGAGEIVAYAVEASSADGRKVEVLLAL
ncbi:MAG TPA: capsid cement protein [Sphingobium sp.]